LFVSFVPIVYMPVPMSDNDTKAPAPTEHRLWSAPLPDDYICDETPGVAATPTKPPRPRRVPIGDKVKARYADGKFRPLERMAKNLEVDVDHLSETLKGIRKNNTYGCTAESKRGQGGQVEWRIQKLDKAISRSELVEKLTPIVRDLSEQARKTMVTMSLTVVARCAGQLQKLLDDWAE
jgi:hypothetical protein